MNIVNIEVVANLIKKHTEPHTFNGNMVSGYHYIFDKYDVYIDSFHNRYIESKDNSFHLVFLKGNGFTAKWGKTLEENPTHCQFGNEIADIEITKMCRGIRNKEGKKTPCPWCYKSNTPNGTYMSFETFKNIFDKLNESKTMTQIAFGVDAEASDVLNPDIWKIMDYCIENNVTPNITVADIDEYTAENLVKRCGAIAVSYYGMIDKERCFDTVKLLLDEAKKINKQMKINIHCLLSKETYESVFELIDAYQNDSRLKGMGSIVFLSLKQKGRGEYFNQISNDEFKKIIDICFEKHISFGMDSCSAPKFLKAIEGRTDQKELETFVESCESFGLFSCYVDAYGKYYPCSFMEKTGKWKEGIDMLKIKNFVNDVWYSKELCTDREKSIRYAKCHKGCTVCPYFKI